jgi:hypothetical protein
VRSESDIIDYGAALGKKGRKSVRTVGAVMLSRLWILAIDKRRL